MLNKNKKIFDLDQSSIPNPQSMILINIIIYTMKNNIIDIYFINKIYKKIKNGN